MGLTITSSYAGKSAGQILSAGLLSSDMIANGGITVKPNVKHKEVINKFTSGSDLIVNSTCDYTDAGTTTMTERVITLEAFQINTTFCVKDFASDWLAAEQGLSAHKDLPDTFAKYIISHYAKKIAEHTEINFFQGSNSDAGKFDSFIVLFSNDSDVVDVTSSAITSSNILTKLGEIADAIPSAVKYSPDMKIYISNADFAKYIRALGGFGASGLGAAGVNNLGSTFYNGQPLSFEGIPIFRTNGLYENTLVAAESTNLFYGTSLLSDQNEIKLIDTRETLGDQNARFVARFESGIQYGIGSEIVLRTNS